MPIPGFKTFPSLALMIFLCLAACSESATESEKNTVPAKPEASRLVTPAAASRFLAQATFGPTQATIDSVIELGFEDWLAQQFLLPQTSMLEDFDQQQLLNPNSSPSRDWVFEAWWLHAVSANDQLRQRIAFALAQIFVISLREGAVANFPRGVASYQSMLSSHAFGNFRELLEDVTLHPMMGAYLSHLGNEKGDPLSGRIPDENFAREIMQLFTIGLFQLNPDGTPALDVNGQVIDSYSLADVQGLAKVFTGFSWAGPDTSTGRFQGWIAAPDREILPMQAYPQFHSTLEKQFLGITLAEQTVSDPLADLDAALDTLFKHPNVGPFIGRQLIQRLVSSNPSASYVARVAAAFSDNGEGIRGDMQAVIRAILLDPEARWLNTQDSAFSGRIREPVLRMTHWIRSFDAHSISGRYRLWSTDDPATSLGMTPYRSPSVFNFYRPGYIPANTAIADAGLTSPEMQITHETSIAGYFNTMLNAINLGTGYTNDVVADYSDLKPTAVNAEKLIAKLDLLLLHGSMTTALRQNLLDAINLIALPEGPAEAREQALLARTRTAIYLAMSSPEYIILK